MSFEIHLLTGQITALELPENPWEGDQRWLCHEYIMEGAGNDRRRNRSVRKMQEVNKCIMNSVDTNGAAFHCHWHRGYTVASQHTHYQLGHSFISLSHLPGFYNYHHKMFLSITSVSFAWSALCQTISIPQFLKTRFSHHKSKQQTPLDHPLNHYSLSVCLFKAVL